MKGKGLIVVGLMMTAVILGAFAFQYYTWTAPTEVTRLTTVVALNSNSESGAMHNGTENWGSNATADNAATAAENIYTPGNERIDLHFRVIGVDTEGLTENFDDLDVQINLYIPGKNLGAQGYYNENCLIENIVSNGEASDNSGYLDNEVNGQHYGFEPDITLAAVIHIFENTKAVGNTGTAVNLPIKIWAEEH